MSLKPLVMWARDQYPQPYKLRYTYRTDEAAGGKVLIGDEWTPFTYQRRTRVLTLGEGETARVIHLNKWGWEQNAGPFFLTRPSQNQKS